MKRPPRFPNKFLVIGVGALFVGGALLLWTSGYLPRLSALWPLGVIIVGLSFLYLSFLKGSSPNYIIPGMVMTVGGAVYLFIQRAETPAGLTKYWPLFMMILGVSMLPYGFKHRGYRRLAVVIPAFAIVFLAAVFLPFSMEITDVTLVDFVLRWWPVLIILLGFGFVITYLHRNRSAGKERNRTER